MEITVVVPVYITTAKQVSMTMKCLELARTRTKIPFELLIVESGANHFQNYRSDIYLRERNASSSTLSMNRAFSCVRTPYTVLLTNDVYVDYHWLETLLETFVLGDCGVSTLASTQFNHIKRDFIEPDGIWFSIAMWRTRKDTFDERFKNVWDDTDFTMRLYDEGLRSYRNHNCVVDHLIGQTQYIRNDHSDNFINGQALFRDKYKDSKHPMFTKLAGL